MGIFFSLFASKKYLSESDLSEDEDLEDCDEEIMTTTNLDSHNAIDAVTPSEKNYKNINLINIKAIEKELDEAEMVALIYLLYEDSKVALDAIEQCLTESEMNNFLYNWAYDEEKRHANWQRKLVEALCIIQNYLILKLYDFNKKTLQQMYLPKQVLTSCLVNPIRKLLYIIAEQLNSTQTQELILKIKKLENSNSLNITGNYLERYFLHLEYNHIDLKTLQLILKQMDMEQFAEQLENVLSKKKQLKKKVNTPLLVKNRTMSTAIDNTNNDNESFNRSNLLNLMSNEESLRPIDSCIYSLHADKPGIVLIINQESFYTETDEKYKHLLHKNYEDIQLENRSGTKVDRNRLANIFNRMNYKVVIKDNLAHYDMLNEIKQVTAEISDESSLIICILTHGENGVVFGVNSCKVEVHDIKNVMCNTNKKLIGKPKMLILQSCQGQQCQKINKIEETETGNSTDGHLLPTNDLIILWATIPGFAAIRNFTKGSWFIQALCDVIEETKAQFNFLEITTRVHNRISQKEWKHGDYTNVMTPMVQHTLTKSLYLPKLNY
ncbi:hypothetical protein ABEB36_003230 [Hypothenemus hampei]|uniref:Caspase-8 n=1 Tax=Hypothenemus hampei TaxID=57062 RepID=A0ABD1FB51_HYPHA